MKDKLDRFIKLKFCCVCANSYRTETGCRSCCNKDNFIPKTYKEIEKDAKTKEQ